MLDLLVLDLLVLMILLVLMMLIVLLVLLVLLVLVLILVLLLVLLGEVTGEVGIARRIRLCRLLINLYRLCHFRLIYFLGCRAWGLRRRGDLGGGKRANVGTG